MTKQEKIKKIYDIIGVSNPNEWDYLYIGDVLDDLEVKLSKFTIPEITAKTDNIIELWYKKREPIENQSEGCINYIYNLLD